MRDILTAAVRTGVQVVVSGLVAWAASNGIEIDSQAVELALFSITAGLVTAGLNLLQAKFPWLGNILSLGLSSENPSY